MKNVMKFGEYDAVISYDPEIQMFRGENLRKEGETSLKVFLDYAKEKNIEPKKQCSGKLVLRLKPEIHQKYKLLAAAKNVSLNQLLNETLEKAV
jgi:predicted HicB family RNase H-like nuclease